MPLQCLTILCRRVCCVTCGLCCSPGCLAILGLYVVCTFGCSRHTAAVTTLSVIGRCCTCARALRWAHAIYQLSRSVSLTSNNVATLPLTAAGLLLAHAVALERNSHLTPSTCTKALFSAHSLHLMRQTLRQFVAVCVDKSLLASLVGRKRVMLH